MIARRLRLGRDVRVLAEGTDEVQLEGAVRLRPGQVVDLIPDVQRGGPTGEPRPALVASWRVARLGSAGTIYRGTCRVRRREGK